MSRLYARLLTSKNSRALKPDGERKNPNWLRHKLRLRTANLRQLPNEKTREQDKSLQHNSLRDNREHG